MLDPILRFSLQHRMLMLLLTLVVAGIGGWSLLRLPIDAVPDITNVQVQVNTTVAALTPEDIERQVTWPIETAMAGIPGLDHTRSLSRNGFSQVTVVFADGTDLFFARQQISERLGPVRSALPEGAEPTMGPVSTGLGEVLMYTVSYIDGKGTVPPEQRPGYLREIQDWVVSPQLRTVVGVAGVDSIGGFAKQYQVTPDPFTLVAYGLTLDDVAAALERGNRSLGAGTIERHGEGLVVRSDGRVRTTLDIGRMVVATREGTPIRIADLAAVTIGREQRSGSASVGGEEAVVGTVLMLLGGNSRTVATDASARLTTIAASLPPDVRITEVLNRQGLVDATIRTVESNLIEGAILVVAVLFALLGNLRGACIAMLAIPLSMLFAVIGMRWHGISGNLMSLGAIDFGIIVDSAVIVVENCLRRLGSRQHALGRVLTMDERLAEVFVATRQMIQPAVFGQAIIITVYVPLLLLSGTEGRMFQPMGWTVIFALVGAFILSLTLVPALVALLVRGRVAEHENRLMLLAGRAYRPVLEVALRLRLLVVAVALVLFGACAWLGGRLGSEFVPTLDEGNVAMHAMRIPSTGIEQSTAMQLHVERAVATVPEVEVVFSKTGTAEMASDPMPPSVSDTFIMLKERAAWPDPTKPKAAVVDALAAAVAQVPGNNYEFTQPIQMRFNELISGVRADVAVKLFGDDFAVLLPAAQRIAAAMQSVPGAASVQVERIEGLPSLAVTPKREALAAFGLSVADVQEVLATAVGGRTTGMVFEGDRRFPLRVILPERLRTDLTALRQLPVPLPAEGGTEPRGWVPLSDVAELTLGEGTNQISREDGKRRIVVQAYVRGRDLGGFVAEARERIARDAPPPPGTWLAWGGQYETLQEARGRLALVVPLCFAVIFLLLYATFGSLKHAVLVFTCVPLALTGGICALWLRDMPFSISAAVGFIALSGVAVLNGLVLVSCINQLRAAGIALDQAVHDGCLERLRPVLMTALVASLGFVPMAFATGTGAEVQKPLATVVIGGIFSSTALTLLVLPALYRLWHRRDELPVTDQSVSPVPTSVT